MFRTDPAARTNRQNRLLAGYLALIAGAVNCASLVLVGLFTSHMTGHVSRALSEAVDGHLRVALFAAGAVLTFFVGAFVTSMASESAVFETTGRTSAGLLLLEAILVSAFAIATLDHVDGWEPMLVTCAMGMQNALVTRLSGAVARTTHLTGIVTDLGIESARWFRHFTVRTPRPPRPKIALLATILACFSVGSAAGAYLAHRFHQLGLVPVIAMLLAGAINALRPGHAMVVRPRISEPDERP